MKRHAMVLLLAALGLGACEGSYTENEEEVGAEGRDQADRDQNLGSRDRTEGEADQVQGDEPFGVRRTGTGGQQPSGTPTTTPPTATPPPSGAQPGGTQPGGAQPGGMQPGGMQPGGMQPGGQPTGMTQPPSGAAAQQASAQLVDTQTKSPIGTLQLQTRGEDVVVKADLAQAQAPSGQTFTVHVAQAATGCTGDASNLVKSAGPALGTIQPGADWKAIPAMDLEGPNSAVGKTIVIQPQAAAGQPATAGGKVYCGVVSGGASGATGGGMGAPTQPSGTQPGGMQPGGAGGGGTGR